VLVKGFAALNLKEQMEVHKLLGKLGMNAKVRSFLKKRNEDV